MDQHSLSLSSLEVDAEHIVTLIVMGQVRGGNDHLKDQELVAEWDWMGPSLLCSQERDAHVPQRPLLSEVWRTPTMLWRKHTNTHNLEFACQVPTSSSGKVLCVRSSQARCQPMPFMETSELKGWRKEGTNWRLGNLGSVPDLGQVLSLIWRH